MLKFLDSFDHYQTSEITKKYTQIYWDAISGPQTTPAIGPYGRRGTNGVQWAADDNPGSIGEVVQTTDPTAIVGLAFRAETGGTFGNLSYGDNLYPTWNGSGWNASIQPTPILIYIRNQSFTQTAVRLNRNGTLSIVQAGDGFIVEGVVNVYDTTTQALQVGQYYYIEYKTLIDSTVGTVELWVNCDMWLRVTGVNTIGQQAANPGTARWDEFVYGRLRLYGAPTDLVYQMDDLYAADGDASDPTNTIVDVMGDIAIDYRKPTADAVVAWTPLSGPSNYLMVDEVPPDDDASYNSTITPGNTDTFDHESAVIPGQNILAQQVVYDRRRPQAGATSTQPVFRVGGVDYVTTAAGDPTDYQFHRGIWTQNPATLAPLTDTVFNASPIGYKKVT